LEDIKEGIKNHQSQKDRQ